MYDHIEKRDVSVIVEGDEGDDCPIDIICCDPCGEENQDDTTTQG